MGVGNARTALVHRWLYELAIGPVPAGRVLDHRCRNRDCCNPLHLKPVTNRVNIFVASRSRPRMRKTHCKNGHPLSGANIFVAKTGARKCRTCLRAFKREWKRRLPKSGRP
jgi:hypothetical protein